MTLTRPVRRTIVLAAATVLASCVAVGPALAATPVPAVTSSAFSRTATYPVYLNAPAGVDPADETAAEISGVTDDGNTVIYTDAPGKRIGFLDITDVNNPVGTGSISLADLGHADDQPTSVAVYGEYVLVVVDESGGDFVSPSGRLDVIRISDRTVVTSIDLGGQPDSISISADKKCAAIAIENQRDEEATPEGGEEGDLPQLPAGFVQVIDLNSDPTTWAATPVPFVAADGSALPSFVDAGLDSPTDPEPEYVTINSKNQLAVTLQENNGIVLVDLPSREITKVFSAGTATISQIDTEDKRIDLTGQITDVPREPDSRSPGSTTPTWPPPTRAIGRAAPAAGPSSTPSPATSPGTPATPSSTSPSPPAYTTTTAQERRAANPKALWSPPSTAPSTASSPPSAATSWPSTTLPTR
jgi:hypothetical protein